MEDDTSAELGDRERLIQRGRRHFVIISTIKNMKEAETILIFRDWLTYCRPDDSSLPPFSLNSVLLCGCKGGTNPTSLFIIQFHHSLISRFSSLTLFQPLQ